MLPLPDVPILTILVVGFSWTLMLGGSVVHCLRPETEVLGLKMTLFGLALFALVMLATSLSTN